MATTTELRGMLTHAGAFEGEQFRDAADLRAYLDSLPESEPHSPDWTFGTRCFDDEDRDAMVDFAVENCPELFG